MNDKNKPINPAQNSNTTAKHRICCISVAIAVLTSLTAQEALAVATLQDLEGAFEPIIKAIAGMVDKYAPAGIFTCGVGGALLVPGGGDLRARFTGAGIGMALALAVVLVCKKWLLG